MSGDARWRVGYAPWATAPGSPLRLGRWGATNDRQFTACRTKTAARLRVLWLNRRTGRRQ